MSVRRKERSLTWPFEFHIIEKAKGEISVPIFVLARIQFESLQRGELDPSFMEEIELPSPLFSAKN